MIRMIGKMTKASRKVSKRYKVVVYDCGVKYNILRKLSSAGCSTTVVPAQTPPQKVLDMNPDGFVLSNGPGDPAAVPYMVDNIKGLLGKKPILGICLGHQLLALTLGLKTYKLKFGHHGGNQPVMDLSTKRWKLLHRIITLPYQLHRKEIFIRVRMAMWRLLM